MTPEEKTQMDALCKRIAEENDPDRFHDLVAELDGLLEQKQGPFQSPRKADS